MLQKIVDDVREGTGLVLRQTSLALAIALFIFITLCFLCAAAFLVALEHYGRVYACLAGAGVFFAATLISLGGYFAYRRRIAQLRAEAARTAMQSALSDPLVIATGLQLVRSIGVRRLVPLLAIGGVVLGLLANRRGGAGPREDG